MTNDLSFIIRDVSRMLRLFVSMLLWGGLELIALQRWRLGRRGDRH